MLVCLQWTRQDTGHKLRSTLVRVPAYLCLQDPRLQASVTLHARVNVFVLVTMYTGLALVHYQLVTACYRRFFGNNDAYMVFAYQHAIVFSLRYSRLLYSDGN